MAPCVWLCVCVCTYALVYFSLFNQHQHWADTSKELLLLEVKYARLAAEVNDNQVILRQQQQEIDHS